MRIFVGMAVMAIIFTSPAYSDQPAVRSGPNTPEWQGIKFGIDEKTLLETGKDKDITKLSKSDELFGPSPKYADYGIDNYDLAGNPAKVIFFFGKESKRLEVVFLQLKDLTKVDGELRCNSLEKAITQKYGSPVHNKNSATTLANYIDVDWISGPLNVSLTCAVGRFLNSVSLRYFEHNGANTSGL